MSDMINYKPIIDLLDARRDSLTNGFTKLTKEGQAMVDHIEGLLAQYEHIIEDLDEDGLASNAAALDEISTQAVQLLLDIGSDNEGIDSVDAADLLELVPFGSIIVEKEIDTDADDTEDD